MSLGDVELAIAAAEAGAEVLRSKYGTPLTRFVKSQWDFASAATPAPTTSHRDARERRRFGAVPTIVADGIGTSTTLY
jgi:hypothetical protein